MICKRCGKKIKPKDKRSNWLTFEDGKCTEDINWHFKCFLDWRDDAITNRAMEAYSKTLNQVMPKFTKQITNMVAHAKANNNQIFQ